MVNVISGLIAQQIPQIGIIKALGGRTAQVTRLYLQMVLVFGTIAVLVAVLGIRQSLLAAIEELQQVKSYDVEIHFATLYPSAHVEREALLDMVIVILLAMAVLVGTVGGLGLASTMGLNVLERTREIGILRSLGAKNDPVRRMVITEGLAVSFVSFLLAVPLSVPLSLLMSDMVGMAILMRSLDYAFSWTGMALWFIVALIIAFVASLLPANSAANLTVRETLAYQG